MKKISHQWVKVSEGDQSSMGLSELGDQSSMGLSKLGGSVNNKLKQGKKGAHLSMGYGK